MPPVAGDPEGIRTSGRRYGSAAAALHSQAEGLYAARIHLAPGVFVGPAGDRVREYLDHLHFSTATAAKAMDRVASAIPRVAHSIEEAQKDQILMKKAEDRYNKAKGVHDRAANAVIKAGSDVTSAEYEVVSAAHIDALSGGHGSGGLAAAQGRLRDAEARLEQAQHRATVDQHLMAEAERDYQRARHTFEQADERRRKELRSFALLCAEEESATTACALPTVPEPGSLIASADHFFTEVNTILYLAGIPRLAAVPIKGAVTTVEGPDGLPSGDDFPSRVALTGDVIDIANPNAPLVDRVESALGGASTLASPSSAGARALAATIGAAQEGQGLAQADPCNAPLVPPPSDAPPPSGPPSGGPPDEPKHPVSTGDKIIGGLLAVGGFLYSAGKVAANDGGPILAGG